MLKTTHRGLVFNVYCIYLTCFLWDWQRAGLVRTGPRLYDWTNTKLGLRIVLDWVVVGGDTRSLLPLLRVKTYVASVPAFRFSYMVWKTNISINESEDVGKVVYVVPIMHVD